MSCPWVWAKPPRKLAAVNIPRPTDEHSTPAEQVGRAAAEQQEPANASV
jgi:hypothetical protein